VAEVPVIWSRPPGRRPTMATTLTPPQMAPSGDLSSHTVRCYERAGLPPLVLRLPKGHRHHRRQHNREGLEETLTCCGDTSGAAADKPSHG
jgi:hypothetical protein